MADKMSMSLDDIVKMSRASKAEKQSGGKAAGGKAKKEKPSRGDKKPYDKPPKKEETKKEKLKKERAPREDAAPNESVFLGNLPFSTVGDEGVAALKAHLSTVAPCTAVDIKLRKNDKPAGFAVATFEDVESATKVVNELHDAEFEGRKLVVKFDNSAKAEVKEE